MRRRVAFVVRWGLALSVVAVAVQLWGVAFRDDARLLTPTFSLPATGAAVAAASLRTGDGHAVVPVVVSAAGLIAAPAAPGSRGVKPSSPPPAPPARWALPEPTAESTADRASPAPAPVHPEPAQPAGPEPPGPAGGPPTSSPEAIPLPPPGPPPPREPPRRHPPRPPPPSLTETPPGVEARDGRDEEEEERDHGHHARPDESRRTSGTDT